MYKQLACQKENISFFLWSKSGEVIFSSAFANKSIRCCIIYPTVVRDIRPCGQEFNKPYIIDPIEIHVLNDEDLVLRQVAKRIVLFRDDHLY